MRVLRTAPDSSETFGMSAIGEPVCSSVSPPQSRPPEPPFWVVSGRCSISVTAYSPPMERTLSASEAALIRFIASGSLPDGVLADLPDVPIREMDDGQMGSLEFVGASDRRVGSTAGYVEFEDTDGVPVSVALLLDQEGRLYQLDIWKVDFTPLIRIPDATLFRASAGSTAD